MPNKVDVFDPATNEIRHCELYLCNPNLNKECDKLLCRSNPTAAHPVCMWTTKPEYASKMSDGRPARVPVAYAVKQTKEQEHNDFVAQKLEETKESAHGWKTCALVMTILLIASCTLFFILYIAK